MSLAASNVIESRAFIPVSALSPSFLVDLLITVIINATYLRPDGVSKYNRPDGSSIYLRP